LYHHAGRFSGQPFRLMPWQSDAIIRPLFGTLTPDGRRQYRTAFVEVPRKNGKTSLAAAIALYLLFQDGEAGAEIYSAAADRDQARRVFGAAKQMVEDSPEIQEAFRPRVYRDVIEYPDSGGIYRVLSADAPTKHGLNPSGVVVDELHALPHRELWDVLTTAQGTRGEPLTLAISTAGFDRNSIAFELHEYGRKVRTDQILDPTFLSVYYGAPDDADWTSRDVWRAANPALGEFLSEDFLEQEFIQAEALPARQNTFRTLYLNQWCSQQSRAIDLALWDANDAHAIDEAALAGRRCCGGLDLAAVSDLTACVYVFDCPHDAAAVDVLARFWVPESQLSMRGRNRHLYQQWAAAGYLHVTPGDACDYAFVKTQVLADAKRFQLADLRIDRLFQGQQLAGELIDGGIPVVEFGQGFMSYAAPMVEFFRRLTAKQVHHGDNPILRWMADNLVVRTDPAGNMKPDKQKSAEKIDGITALVMALGAFTRPSASAREPRIMIFGAHRQFKNGWL
jgi:phage terminase large subunit-like protein